MSPERTVGGSNHRGMAEVIGVVLIVGIAVGMALVVFAGGMEAIDATKGKSEEVAAVSSMEQVRADLATLAKTGDSDPVQVDLGGNGAGATGTVNATPGNDTMTLVANGSEDCRTTVDLGGLRYELMDGPTVTYQAGALWEHTESGLVALSWPSVTYAEGTVDLEVVSIQDVTRTDGAVEIRELQDTSSNRTIEAREGLIGNQECYRPDTLTLSVTSDEYAALWREHFEREFPDTAEVERDDDRVTLHLDHEELPTAVNDSTNEVVNLTDGKEVTGYVENDRVVLDKGEDNEYGVSLSLVDSQVGYEEYNYETVTKWDENETVTIEDELDLMFVLDASGSMKGDGENHNISEGEPYSRMGNMKLATVGFIDDMNESWRGAVVPFGHRAWVDESMTGHTGALKDSVRGIEFSGRTDIAHGLEKANDHLDDRGNPNHTQVIIVLTDGEGDQDDNPLDDHNAWLKNQSRRAADEDRIVQTVGVADSPEDEILREVADIGGGSYFHVSNASDLDLVFQGIRHDIVNETWEEKVLTDRFLVDAPTEVTVGVGDEEVPLELSAPSPSVTAPVTRHASLEDGEEIGVEQLTVFNCDGVRSADGDYREVHPDGDVYEYAECEGTDGVNQTSREVSTYVDGDQVPAGSGGPWWQDTPEDLIPREHVRYEDGDPVFDLDSNQMVALVEMEEAGTTTMNNAVLVMDIGASHTGKPVQWLFDPRISHVEIDDS